MKDAAARDVDASLRLEQLKEVFGAEQLDAGERARIQTALQMAGLEPQPSLLEADPADPIRFAVAGGEAATPAPAAVEAAPAERRQEFPTVGEFARSAFGRFRRKRRAGGGEGEVTAATEAEAEAETEADEPEAFLPEPELEVELEPEREPEVAEPEPVNGHAETNGHAHIDLLDDVALPPHDTATPSDFGASAETIDFDDPRVEDEILHEIEAEAAADEFEPELEPEPDLDPEPEWESLPEPVAPAATEEPVPAAAAEPARTEEIAALLLPLVAIPVLITSFAGWSFGLPFVALSTIATGVLAGRRAGFLATLRRSAAARTMLRATLLVTAVSVAVAVVLANVGDGGNGGETPRQPAAKTPSAAPPAARKREPTAKAPARPKRDKPARRTETAPQAPPPDEDTKDLIKAPPPSQSATTPAGTPTQTTPAPQPRQP